MSLSDILAMDVDEAFATLSAWLDTATVGDVVLPGFLGLILLVMFIKAVT